MVETANVLVLEPNKKRMTKMRSLFRREKVLASYASDVNKAMSIIKAEGPRHLLVDAKRLDARKLGRIMLVSGKTADNISIHLLKDVPLSDIESLIKGFVRKVKDPTIAENYQAPSLSEVIKDLGISQEILARIVGTSARSVARWIKGGVAPSKIYQERLDKVISIHSCIKRLLKKEAIPKYFKSYNEALGGKRPLDLLLNQEFDKVLSDLSALEEGVFT